MNECGTPLSFLNIKLIMVIVVFFIILWTGLEILHIQEDRLNSFCENKTGIVENVNCDCWQNKPCQELPEGCCVYV